MLRLTVILAALWPASAWADAPLDVAGLVRDGGPWGMVTVLCAVIAYLWTRLGSCQETIAALQEKRNAENTDWAGKYATVATTAAQEIRSATGELEKQERLTQALLDIAKTWPPAIDAILKGLDRNGERMNALPETLRSMIARRAEVER